MFVIFVEQFPASDGRIEVLPVAGRHVEVEERFQRQDQVAMRTVVRIFPDRVDILVDQLLHPEIFLVVTLHDLQVFGFSYRRKIKAGAGDDSLASLSAAADQFRQIGAGVEPVVKTAQQRIGFRISCDSRFDQSLSHPRTAVSSVFEMQDIAFGISHEVSVRLFAGFDAVDDPVHPVAQFAVFDPAQLVARAHQKATRFRTGQNVDPFGMQVAQCPVRRYSGPLAELFQHIVYGKRLKQVMGVGIERSAEQSVVYGDAAARNPRRRFDRPPACRRSDVFGTIQYGDFSHRALRSQ